MKRYKLTIKVVTVTKSLKETRYTTYMSICEEAHSKKEVANKALQILRNRCEESCDVVKVEIIGKHLVVLLDDGTIERYYINNIKTEQL
uniref:Uncharacterized protein n=1 Tax=Dulem virus 36 TaxID=3145754 RepID=A0AAU8AYJ9_9CAUD